MNNNVNIIILAAGSDQVSQTEEFPICLTELDSSPLIQKLIELTSEIDNSKIFVCFSKSDCDKYHLDNIVKILNSKSEIIKIPVKTQGAACTALLCAGEIDNENELLIINGNELININFNNVLKSLRERNLDAGVVVFNSIHPRYSYVKINDNNLVIEASEKRPISNLATTGFYWFKSGSSFVKGAKDMIRKDARVNDNFFICPVFNELVLENYKIGTYKIDEKNYYPLKDLKQLQDFENKFEKNIANGKI